MSVRTGYATRIAALASIVWTRPKYGGPGKKRQTCQYRAPAEPLFSPDQPERGSKRIKRPVGYYKQLGEPEPPPELFINRSSKAKAAAPAEAKAAAPATSVPVAVSAAPAVSVPVVEAPAAPVPVEPPTPTAGSRVKANWMGYGKWYKGTVKAVYNVGTANESYDVHYDDGDQERVYSPERLLPLGGKWAKEATKQGASTSASASAAVVAEDGCPIVSEAEGYKLHLSSKNPTGYVGVAHTTSGRYEVRFGKTAGAYVGIYDTAVEGALAYAKRKIYEEEESTKRRIAAEQEESKEQSSSKEQEQAEDSKSMAASDEKTSNAAGKKRKPPQQSSAASREEKKLGTSIGFGVAMYPSANVKAPTDKKSNYIYVADKDLLPPKPLASSRVNHRLYQAAIPPMLSEEERRAERSSSMTRGRARSSRIQRRSVSCWMGTIIASSLTMSSEGVRLSGLGGARDLKWLRCDYL